MINTSRVFLIDGMALLFRSFYAMGRANLTSPGGAPIGAVFGFMKICQKILKEQKATHFAVTWDLKEKTFRHDMYPAYKGTRSETPPELLEQIPLIKDVVEKCGIPNFSKAGFEGDDVLVTLALKCANETLDDRPTEVFIVSSDKDFMQIVSDKIKIFSLKSGDGYEVCGPQHVQDYFGVPPEKVIDVLSIMGDKVDNVPGVKGIGDKGAAKLIEEFGSVENLYENLEKVRNERIRGLLKSSKDDVFLSKKLVTIDSNVELGIEPGRLSASLKYDWSQFCGLPGVRQSFAQLRMTSLIKGLEEPVERARAWPPKQVTLFDLPDESSPQNSQNSQNVQNAPSELNATSVSENYKEAWGQRNYVLVHTEEVLHEVLARICSPDTSFFAFDTETTGLDIIESKPIGFSVAFEVGRAYYIPTHAVHVLGVAKQDSKEAAQFPANWESTAWSGLGAALQQRTATMVGHNIKFDLHQLSNRGVSFGTAPIACSMVAAWLLDSSAGGFGLDAQTSKLLGLKKIATSELIGKGKGGSMLDVPLAIVGEYAAEDADATVRIWEVISPRLAEATLANLYWNIEMPLLLMLLGMERNGIHINSEALAQLAGEIQERLNEVEALVHAAAGAPFNLASPKQLGAVLFENLKVHEAIGFKGKLAKTTLGYKTDASVLENFAAHPIVALVQEYRELSKLLSTYVLVLPQLVKASTHRIHTSFNQIGTSTGRLSSHDPNLQNIPVRSELGKKVRRAFCASSPENCILSVDYSQVELRVMAHLSNDPNMIEAFKAGSDIHRETAAKILGKNISEVTGEERSNAKAINFGIIYGMGPQRLAREQKISLNEAKAFIEKYFLNFAKVREYLDQQRIMAHQVGYVSTFFGRKRNVSFDGVVNPREISMLENVAINSPIQGTAADIMKIGMLRVHAALQAEGYQTRVLLQVHDELVLEGPLHEAAQVKTLLKAALQGAVEFVVPFVVDVSQGQNWLEAK